MPPFLWTYTPRVDYIVSAEAPRGEFSAKTALRPTITHAKRAESPVSVWDEDLYFGFLACGAVK